MKAIRRATAVAVSFFLVISLFCVNKPLKAFAIEPPSHNHDDEIPLFDMEHIPPEVLQIMNMTEAELIQSLSSQCYCEQYGGSRKSLTYVCSEEKILRTSEMHTVGGKSCQCNIYKSKTGVCCSGCYYVFTYTYHDCWYHHLRCDRGWEHFCPIGFTMPPGIYRDWTLNMPDEGETE